MRRTLLRITIALLTLAAAISLGATPSAAHEGEGVLVLESQEPADSGGIRYLVRLTWVNDGHAALDVTLTATPIAPDGTAGTPVPLQPVDQDGRYAGVVPFASNGTWTVRFTAVTPPATIEVIEEVALPEATTTTAAARSTSSTAAPVTTLEEGQAGGDGNDEDIEANAGGSARGGPITVVVLVLLVIAAVVGFARSTRRSRGRRVTG